MDSNEAHNNGKYGLRIFTGLNHNGEGLPGFYPRKVDSCAPVNESNPFEPAEFTNFFSWRNGHNGITFGSVAALRIVDAVVADNLMRGIEATGADGINPGSMDLLASSMTTLRGPWGANVIVRPIIIGHAQDGCPACDHSQRPVYPASGGPAGYGPMRLGLTTAAAWGLTVENATFINYDRPGMAAVAGSAKMVPANAGYDFVGNGGAETRFSGTRWVESQYRARWRWQSEALLTDVDGTFAEQPFCAGCHVLKSNLLATHDAFPDCYQDKRYDGSVCKPQYRFVVAGFKATPPCGPCANPPIRLSYRNEDGLYVRAGDASYLRHKWRAASKFNLVELDISSKTPMPKIVGEHDSTFHASWTSASGEWLSRRRLSFNFTFTDQLDGQRKHATNYEAVISEDGATLTFQVNSATMSVDRAVTNAQLAEGLPIAIPINGSQTPQLYTDVVWHRCELKPHMCEGDGIRYPNQPKAEIGRGSGSFQIMGNLLYVDSPRPLDSPLPPLILTAHLLEPSPCMAACCSAALLLCCSAALLLCCSAACCMQKLGWGGAPGSLPQRLVGRVESASQDLLLGPGSSSEPALPRGAAPPS